ncbi:hypothetical protein [Thalassospira sp. TSL5-1]|uniref:hypothetical protein n=1 Tax=Thalassospira sp. TSL5-1 TaxID=1544451 RepID=UPI0011613AEC|nr:hypothetical protein [Thalassospira sp. TSL5-1]
MPVHFDENGPFRLKISQTDFSYTFSYTFVTAVTLKWLRKPYIHYKAWHCPQAALQQISNGFTGQRIRKRTKWLVQLVQV